MQVGFYLQNSFIKIFFLVSAMIIEVVFPEQNKAYSLFGKSTDYKK
jgi:hypothetical protein